MLVSPDSVKHHYQVVSASQASHGVAHALVRLCDGGGGRVRKGSVTQSGAILALGVASPSIRFRNPSCCTHAPERIRIIPSPGVALSHRAAEYTTLGAAGLKVSRLGLGCWAIGGHGYGRTDDAESIRVVKTALEVGVTFFDTADVYGFGHSEAILGAALGSRRHDVIIATKIRCGLEQQRQHVARQQRATSGGSPR